MDVKIGCCGFPVKHQEYAARFHLVEVQQTFYQPPLLATARKWRQEMPPDFDFTLKAWQLITHEARSPTYRRLRRKLTIEEQRQAGFFKQTPLVREAWKASREIAQALDARIILFQCPASFTPTPEHLSDLRRFFEETKRGGLLFAWEPRGSWPRELVADLCGDLVLIAAVDPFATPPFPASLGYFRLHGRSGYRYTYTTTDFNQLAGVLGRYEEVCVLFNNLTMWDDARRFAEFLGKEARPFR
ncbi:MAG: DUF72 domain-containing protein [Syntrophobacterales bacterium]